MLRKLATVALCVSSIAIASDFAKATTDRSDKSQATQIAAKHLMATCQRYNVTHDKNGFRVNGQRVHTYDLDPSLRQVKSGSQLRDLFKSDRSRLLVTKVGTDYALKRYEPLNGGGVIGATLGGWFGYGAVNGVAQGAVYAVCLPIYAFNPALGYVVNAGAAAVVNALVQPVAITAAVGCAIAGGVATGPV